MSLFDGSMLRLETLAADHDYTNPVSALSAIHEAERSEKHVTGLLYYDSEVPTATDTLGLSETPLVDLPDQYIRPVGKVWKRSIRVSECNCRLLLGFVEIFGPYRSD